MKCVNLESGFDVSVLGLGTYHLTDRVGEPAAVDAVLAAQAGGIELIDTSDNYGSELVVAQALRETSKPDKLLIATKTGLGITYEEHLAIKARGAEADTSPERVRTQLQKSLRMLGQTSIYLYQLHAFDKDAGIDELVRTMHGITEEQRFAEHYGVCNYSREQLERLLEACDKNKVRRPSTTQPFYNILTSFGGQDAIDLALSEGLAVLAHSPLHKGFLSEASLDQYARLVAKEKDQKRFDGSTIKTLEEAVAQVQRLREYANAHGYTLSEYALAWLMNKPFTVALNSCVGDERLKSSLKAAEWVVDPEGMILGDEVRSNEAVSAMSHSMLTLAEQSRPYYRKM
jgi:aryl-alcohol dehydrogenase-like predicted oxidoreductase